jgi:hypothetical protein
MKGYKQIIILVYYKMEAREQIDAKDKRYYCETCDYGTNKKTDFVKHENTDKHKMAILISGPTNTPIEISNTTCTKCGYCKQMFQDDAIDNHMANCQIMILQKKIDQQAMEMEKKEMQMQMQMQKQLDQLKFASLENILKAERESKKEILDVHKEAKTEIVEAKDQIVEILREENKNKNQVLNKVSTTAVNATSALKYITTHYANAPPLAPIPIEDYSEIFDEDAISDIIVNRLDDGTVHEFLGDILIKLLRKDDPEIQALWNSDAARQTFLIKTLKEWTVDKKGINFTDTVINPFLTHIQDILFKHKAKVYDSTKVYLTKVENLKQEMYKWDRSTKVANERGPRPNHDDKIKKLNTERQELDMAVIRYGQMTMHIGMDKFTPAILKYIGPYFAIDKNGNTSDPKTLTFEKNVTNSKEEEALDESDQKAIVEVEEELNPFKFNNSTTNKQLAKIKSNIDEETKSSKFKKSIGNKQLATIKKPVIIKADNEDEDITEVKECTKTKKKWREPKDKKHKKRKAMVV